MYFTRIELHNYGIYQGTHLMDLQNQLGSCNITLVGGLNGRGKTTLHDAILIALYDKQALKYIQEKARSYDRLLLEHINKHATDEDTYVSVSLVLDDGTQLRIKRSWRQCGKKIDHSLIVEKNGVIDKYLGESWNYYVEEVLPFGIARFFFFNNEKITQLADDASFEQIKNSIKSAIGVTAIEKAIDHIDEVIRRKRSAIERFEHSELNQGYKETEAKIAELNASILDATQQKNILERQCENLTAIIEVKEKEFWSSGGDLGRNRNAIKDEMRAISASVEEIYGSIIQLASDAATPLYMCRGLVVQSYNHEKEVQEADARRRSDKIVADLYSRIMQKIDDSHFDSGTSSLIKQIIREEIKEYSAVADRLERTNLTAASMMLFEKLISTAFQNIVQRIESLISAVESQENTLLNLDAHLGNTDDKTMAMKLFEALKDIEKEKALADDTYIKHLAHLDSLEQQREQLKTKRLSLIKDIAGKEIANDDDARIIKYAAMSIEVLTAFKVRLQSKKLLQLSDMVTSCFKILVEKDSLVSHIEIDPKTLDITLLDADGNELLKNQLSAGEQQMFAVSIVWGLALTSGYKAPVVIDTPMARLDSAHRANFISKYLPAASSQVIVLSTDEEVYGKYLDLIRENIIDYYTLVYHESEQCTTIKKGYFEGV